MTLEKEQALGKRSLRLFHNRRLTPVVTPEFGHVLPSQEVRVIFEPTGQPGSPGRRRVGGQQFRHQAVNLVPGEHRVTQQQASQTGQGEPQGRRRYTNRTGRPPPEPAGEASLRR